MKTSKTSVRPQPGDAKTINAALEVIYEACRRAEENGWTVDQEAGASTRTRLVEPAYALLLNERGKITFPGGASFDAQDKIAAILTERLGTRISRVRVDQLCEGFDSSSWGHEIDDEELASESWFRAGWALGRAMEAGERPWWGARKQRRTTTGWAIKIGSEYLAKPATIGTRKTGKPAVWTSDKTRVHRFDDYREAWETRREHGGRARIVRLLRRAA